MYHTAANLGVLAKYFPFAVHSFFKFPASSWMTAGKLTNVVVVVDFIIYLGESQQAVPFYRKP